MTLPRHLMLETNKLVSPDPWLVLLKITLTGPTIFRLVRNTEDIYFNDGSGSGNELYTAFPFELETTSIGSEGEISTLTLKVNNITRLIQPYLETLNGGIGSVVKIMVIHFSSLTLKSTGKVADYADLIQTYDTLGCSSNSKWVTFTLGAPSPLRQVFPPYKYLAPHCGWQFDKASTPSPECDYRTYGNSSNDLTCKRTHSDCLAHGNEPRYGGFVGLQTGGIRIV